MLLDEVFAKFDDDCRNIIPGAKAYRCAQLLKNQMSNFYDKEQDCTEALRLVLGRMGFPIDPGKVGDTEYITDGHFACTFHPVIIVEVKNEIGTGGADPFFQATEYYRHFIAYKGLWTFLDELFPCFIITVTGAKIFFSGAVYTQGVTTESFGALEVDFHDTNNHNYDMLARYLTALEIAYQTLKTRYSNARDPPEVRTLLGLPLLPETDRKHIEDAFPYPRSFVHAETREERKFEYVKAFEEKPFVFKARTDNDQLVCIKFVRRYGTKVYKWCVKKGFAPELLESRVLDGGWIMIVMEFLGNTWKEFAYEADKQQQKLHKSIASFVENLGGERMVHGDIRERNIMVNDTAGFKLIDFDWAGMEGEVLYPSDINLDPVLGRPLGVGPCEKILHEHDQYMVGKLFK